MGRFVRGQAGRPPVRDEDLATGGSLRQRLIDAQQTVILVSDLFLGYVKSRVVRNCPDDFSVTLLDPHRAHEIDSVFGLSRSSAESRYVHVCFQDDASMYLKVEAVVLSRTVVVRTLFARERTNQKPRVAEIDLDRYGSFHLVRWEEVFDGIFLDFFDWCEDGGR